MSLLIKNGTVVTATEMARADVFIKSDKVQAIGVNLNVTAERTVDAHGCYLLPGGIDAHTHMELPFMGTYSSDTFESGTLAGLHGGTTTIIDFAIQTQGDTLNNAINQWNEKANGKAVGDYAFHCAVTDFNDKTRAEIRGLIEDRGVTSFKTFMAYKGALMIDDRQMIGLFEEVKKHGGLLTVHAENGDIVDANIARNLATGTSPRISLNRHPSRAIRRLRRMGHIETRYYMRFMVTDKPGVLARIAGVLGRHHISIASVHQKERKAARVVPVVMMTHEVRESNVRRALAEIDRSGFVKQATVALRTEAPRSK